MNKKLNSCFTFVDKYICQKSKHSQITPLIIVAFIIVIILIFLFIPSNNLKFQNVDDEIKLIYDYVQECIKETGERAILDTSSYGGYFISPEESLENGIPYYFRNGKNLMPNKERIENEIGNYVNDLNFFCINNFEKFEDYIISDEEIKAIVNIEKEKVIFNVYYPISITKGERSYNLKSFYLEIPARLDEIYDASKFIIDQQVKDTKSICITCLDEVSSNDFYVNALQVDDRNIIYTIKDEKVKINNESLVFNFASELDEL